MKFSHLIYRTPLYSSIINTPPKSRPMIRKVASIYTSVFHLPPIMRYEGLCPIAVAFQQKATGLLKHNPTAITQSEYAEL